MNPVCPLCHQDAFRQVWVTDGLSSGCCTACGHVYSVTDKIEPYEAFGQSCCAEELLKTEHPLFVLARHRVDLICRFRSLRAMNMLELGCGYGHFLRRMQDAGATVTGFEPASKGVEFAREYFGLRSVKNKAFNPGNDRVLEEYDLIAAFHMLEHVTRPRAYVQAWADALRPNGLLAIAVPSLYTLHRDLHELYFIARGWHRHTFSPQVLCELIEHAGLQILHTEDEPPTSMSPSSYLVIAAKKVTVDAVHLPNDYPDPCATLESFHADLESLCQAIAAWIEKRAAQGRTIAIFGAGLHTEAVFALCPFEADRIHCVIDDDQDKWGRRLRGIEVVGTRMERAGACDAILVSSLAAETTILARLRQELPGTEVAGIYRDLAG